MNNTSGQGKGAVVPDEIKHWNWGAFLWTWIWGIGNSSYLAFLVFVPLLGFVMPFVLGAKGSSWAWQNKQWESVEHFKRVQRKWALWGVGFLVLFVAAIAAAIFFGLSSVKGSDVYQQAVASLESNSEAKSILGSPIETGMPVGNFEVSGPSGSANFSFSAKGPKAEGTVYLTATKDLGAWKINRIEFEINNSGKRIDLNNTERRTTRKDAESPTGNKPLAAPPNENSATVSASGTEPVAETVPEPVQAEPQVLTHTDSGNTSTKRAKRREPSDLRDCLNLQSNEAIAKCAGE
jgi:hypothetical protein